MGEFRIYSNGQDITTSFINDGGHINNGTGEIIFPSNNGNDDNIDVVYNVIWKSNNISSNQSSVTVKECKERGILRLLDVPTFCLNSGGTFDLKIESKDRKGNAILPEVYIDDDRTDEVFRDYIVGNNSSGEFDVIPYGDIDGGYVCSIKSVKKYEDSVNGGSGTVVLGISNNSVEDAITCNVSICNEYVSGGTSPTPVLTMIYVIGEVMPDITGGYMARVTCSSDLPSNINIRATVAYHVVGSEGSRRGARSQDVGESCNDTRNATTVLTINPGEHESSWLKFYNGDCVCELDTSKYCGGLGSLTIIKTGSHGYSVNVYKCGGCNCNETATVKVDDITYITRGEIPFW